MGEPGMKTIETIGRTLAICALAVATSGLPAVACGPAATPAATPTAVSTPVPSATSTPVEAVEEWKDSPECSGIERLSAAFAFEWEEKEKVGEPDTWEYYSCQ